ncbi:purine-nucleoside phosphorylase [bacterium]|nr:purine-nucleoside phosphorylase [bacterium]
MPRDTHDPGVADAVAHVRDRFETEPLLGFILGSGLGSFAEEVSNPVMIPTAEIPKYPASTVPGHAGRLVCGDIDGIPVVIVQGRVHAYEGYPLERVVFPVRLLAALGVGALVVTNASGCTHDGLHPGDLMAIRDQVNLMGVNPLVGQHWGFDRFPDMSRAYDPDLLTVLQQTAREQDIPLKEGIVGAWIGPTYETSAEVRLLRSIGVDAACMSTIPEVIAAARLRVRVAGVSCITNYATGVSDRAHSHDEVVETAGRVEHTFRALLREAVKPLADAL